MVTNTIRSNEWNNIKSKSWVKGTTAYRTALLHHGSLCQVLTYPGDYPAPQRALSPNVVSQLYVVKSPGLQELWTHTHVGTCLVLCCFPQWSWRTPLISRAQYELPARSLLCRSPGLGASPWFPTLTSTITLIHWLETFYFPIWLQAFSRDFFFIAPALE